MALKSYVASNLGLRGRLSELANLYRWQSKATQEQVRTLIARLRDVEKRVADYCGMSLTGQRMLDIGPGQKLHQMAYFAARGNDVTGIDLDLIAQTLNPIALLRMARVNGPMRAAKTAGRKLLGIDNKFRRELARQLNAPRPRRLNVQQMDATQLRFPDGSFDCVYSFSTFEHLPEPGKVIDEVVRVLRPGGVAYLSLHLFTSENGGHDPRVFAGRREMVPYWAHLRPAEQHKTHSNAYLNKIREAQWREIFSQHLPGDLKFFELQYAREQLTPELRKLREAGELAEYTDDELMTVDFVALWQKPKGGAAL